MKNIKSGKNPLLLFMAIIIVIIVIVVAPSIYKSYQEVFNPNPDSDGDGWPDKEDAFPDNPDEHSDNDHDGIGDNADNDDDNDGILDGQDYLPYSDAEIRVEISRIRIKDFLVLQKQTGKIFMKIYIDDKEYVLPGGGVKEVNIDEDIPVNWSVTQNVDDSIGFHTIKIEMYYKNIINVDKPLDINGEDADKETGTAITIDYYIGNKIGHQYPSDREFAISDGSDDGNGLEKDAMIIYRIVTVSAS